MLLLLADVGATGLKSGIAKNWLAVLNWGSSILNVPKRGRKKHNVTSVIKKWIASYPNSVAHNQVSPKSHQTHKSDSSRLSQAVSAKLEEENLRATIRIICSDNCPAQPSREAPMKLQDKHPPASGGWLIFQVSIWTRRWQLLKMRCIKRFCHSHAAGSSWRWSHSRCKGDPLLGVQAGPKQNS